MRTDERSTRFFDEFEKEITKNAIDELVGMITPAYSKYLTISDLKEIILFYKSPIGQKFTSKTPLIIKESMAVGAEWSKKVVKKILTQLDEENRKQTKVILEQ